MQSHYNSFKLFSVLMSLLFVNAHSNAQMAPGLLSNIIFRQAELNPAQHVNNRNQAELFVLDNGVQPSFQNQMWFDAEVKVKTRAALRRSGRDAYIEFISFNVLSERKVTTSYKVHCAEGCAAYTHVYAFEYDANRNDWQITSNTSFYTRID